MILKKLLINLFCESKNVTEKNRNNIDNCIKTLKDGNLKKELSAKVKVHKEKSNIAHHRKQIKYYCENKADENRFQTAWF
jgi:hypothetical protein